MLSVVAINDAGWVVGWDFSFCGIFLIGVTDWKDKSNAK